MNYLNYYNKNIDRMVIRSDCKDLPAVRRAVTRFNKDIFYVDETEDLKEQWLNQRTIFVTRPRGKTVGQCPGSAQRKCCNYITTDVYLGCSIGCSYCIMKSYLNFSPLTVYADPTESIAQIRRIAGANPRTLVRVGSGEVGDSLLLDPLFELSSDFIVGLSDLPNVAFESKTKTDYVEHLLEIKNKGSAVIGFSLNPQSMIDSEEPFAASLQERIAAAHKSVDAGYKIAFHFDPVYREPAEVGEYNELIRKYLLPFDPKSLAWISFGTIRYTAALKEKMGKRPYLKDEFICGPDGKYRYIQKKRVEIFRKIIREFDTFPDAPLYFCMENEAVWEAVFGTIPEETARASFLFTPLEGVTPHVRLRDQKNGSDVNA